MFDRSKVFCIQIADTDGDDVDDDEGSENDFRPKNIYTSCDVHESHDTTTYPTVKRNARNAARTHTNKQSNPNA